MSDQQNQQKKLPKWAKICIIFGSVLVLLLGIIGLLYINGSTYSDNYKSTEPDKIEIDQNKNVKTIFANGRSLYDKDGNKFIMKGVNFGNWLIQEGWMTVNSIGIEYNDDGSYKKINEDKIIESYLEMCQDDLEDALKNNPNLTEDQIDLLWDAYHKSYCKEEDFINIKNLGLNTIRLPMYYRNFMEGPDDNLTMKEDAFELVDWFLEMAKKHGLFVVLDMHGVVGGHNGFEHSGTFSNEFWDNEHYQKQMAELWKNIARHYVEERPDLAYTIATYDLINEPATATTSTTKKHWDVLDKIYDAIREVDKDHVITIEGVWYFNNLPNPDDYGWENVMYEYHFYNWNYPQISNDLFYALQFNTFMLADYDVPKYIGEFSFFDKKDEWIKWLNVYDKMEFNWTFWSYKTISVGWWDTSWGLYVYKMNLFNEQKKLDLRTATYEEIFAEWSSQGTSEKYNSTGICMESIKEYFSQLSN